MCEAVSNLPLPVSLPNAANDGVLLLLEIRIAVLKQQLLTFHDGPGRCSSLHAHACR